MGIVTFSDPSGHFEGVLFSEGLALYRDLLEPGKAVLLAVGAELQGEEVRVRIQSPSSRSTRRRCASRRASASSWKTSAPSTASPAGCRARATARSAWTIRLADAASEVEVKLPGRFAVSPQIAGAIKAVPGVQAVMEM